MSTKNSIAYGNKFHIYKDAMDKNDVIHISLKETDYTARNKEIDIELSETDWKIIEDEIIKRRLTIRCS